eukprot:10490482-Alexandrium_andersonii.AAC.1
MRVAETTRSSGMALLRSGIGTLLLNVTPRTAGILRSRIGLAAMTELMSAGTTPPGAPTPAGTAWL